MVAEDFAPSLRRGEYPRLPTDHKDANETFDRIVVHGQSAVIAKMH